MNVLIILSNEQETTPQVQKDSKITTLVYKPNEKLSFDSETFDSIFSNVSDELLLKEVFRVLKKDGSITTVAKSDLDLMMAGFSQVEKTENEKFSAKKPNYETNTAFSLKSKEKKPTWKVSIDVDEGDLINEDELLEEDDLKKPVLKEKCSTQKKACKNCTCGRAEGKIIIENTSDLEIYEEQQKKGGCGSCGLGDAFRCSTCPYLGKPAFKPGEKIQIKL